MEFQFIKHSEENEKTKAVVYLPLHSCNILSFSHMISKLEKDGEITELEILHIEEAILEEHTYKQPLKKAVMTKRTKDVEHYDVEEIVKVMEPRVKSFAIKEEIQSILTWLEKHTINP